MGRPKLQDDTVPADLLKALIRARAARESVMRSIRNIHVLSEYAKSNADGDQNLLARVPLMEKYIDQFETHQQEILSILMD